MDLYVFQASVAYLAVPGQARLHSEPGRAPASPSLTLILSPIPIPLVLEKDRTSRSQVKTNNANTNEEALSERGF